MPTSGKRKDLQNEPDKPVIEAHLKSAEPREELRSRLRQKEADAEYQRHKEKVILWAVVIIVSLVTLLCLGLVLLSGIQPETTKWATTLLTTVVAGGVGYMTGKGSK